MNKMTSKDIKVLDDKDVEFINFAYSLINSAKYPDFQKVTNTYNKIFGASLNHTSCGSCIRQRILEMKQSVDGFMKKLEEKEKVEELKENLGTN